MCQAVEGGALKLRRPSESPRSVGAKRKRAFFDKPMSRE